MKNAIIGSSGYVGSNLFRYMHHCDAYNTRNILDIRQREYDTVYCAGIPAVKWYANSHPTDDLDNIKQLLKNILQVKCNKFVLFSTIDVFEQPVDADETDTPNSTEPYGKHRRMVEEVVESGIVAPHYQIIRLPALFGKGLKKNVIYDMLNNRPITGMDGKSSFVWYNIENLIHDLTEIEVSNNAITHISSPQITLDELYKTLKCEQYRGSGKLIDYKFKSIYKPDGMWYSKEDIMQQITKFYVSEAFNGEV